MSQTDYEIDNADVDPLDFHDTDTAQAMARDWQGLQPAVLARAGQILAVDVDRLGEQVDSATTELERLRRLLDAAHGLICNAHQKRVDDVTTDDGASPGWAEAARRWIDAYPFGSL